MARIGEPTPVGLAAATTLGVLAIGEHFTDLAAGVAAYGAAWWLLRDPVEADASP